MNTADQVERLRTQMLAAGKPKPEIIREVALACVGWPYVFGAWGELCLPANRRRRVRDTHPTIKSKCQVLTGKRGDCAGCQWYPQDEPVRMYDCRGFTRWLLQQVGLDIVNSAGKACQTVTNQYNAANNWLRRGPINEIPDCVCNVFDLKRGHTGMHIGGGTVVDCSVNVRISKVSDYTNYAIPKGLYGEGEIPVEVVKPTLRKGASGPEVIELQEILTMCGYDCGGVDGKFGTRTRNAVVAFQTEVGLDPDGVVGAKTWKALAVAEAQAPMAPATPDQVQKYRVTIEGVTWQEYRRILEICPMADATKE